MATQCSLCLLDLLCPLSACTSHVDGCCGAKQAKMQSHDWPFLSAVTNPSTCIICGDEERAHKTGIQGGKFCKNRSRSLCCNCGKKLGIGYCIEKSCRSCVNRRPAVLEASVREQMQAIPPPDHLVVLIHGIDGYPTELYNLQNKLDAFRNEQGHKTFIPFAPDCCVGKTHSGIAACGDLMTSSVKEFVELCNKVSPNTLTQISFVCHSLGGLIGRYAVGKLADREEEEQQTIAGLKAKSFVSTASPHLGLEKAFGLPKLPRFITQPVSGLVAGKSGQEIFDQKEGGVVRRLAEAGGEFVEGLGRFEGRRMYALEGGDHIIGADRSLLLPPERFRPRSAPPSTPLHPAVQVWALHGPSPPALLSEPWAAPLEALGWSKLLLRMPSIPWWLPNGHLKITANHKEGMYGDVEGNAVMEDVVDFLAGSAV